MPSKTLFALLLAAAPAAAFAQSAAELKPAAPPPGVTAGPQAPAPAPPVIVSGDWSRRDAQDLLAFIDGIDAEGLSPADYVRNSLAEAIDGKNSALLSGVATRAFILVAHDLTYGHVMAEGRIDWHVRDDPFTAAD